jgi:hypothetical protein
MAANPLGAHQAGSSFRRPHDWRYAGHDVGWACRLSADGNSRHALFSTPSTPVNQITKLLERVPNMSSTYPAKHYTGFTRARYAHAFSDIGAFHDKMVGKRSSSMRASWKSNLEHDCS